MKWRIKDGLWRSCSYPLPSTPIHRPPPGQNRKCLRYRELHSIHVGRGDQVANHAFKGSETRHCQEEKSILLLKLSCGSCGTTWLLIKLITTRARPGTTIDNAISHAPLQDKTFVASRRRGRSKTNNRHISPTNFFFPGSSSDMLVSRNVSTSIHHGTPPLFLST